MPMISYSRTLLAIILQVLLLAFGFLAFAYLRLQQFDPQILSFCPSGTVTDMQMCAHQIITGYMLETTWLARIMLAMLLMAAGISYFFCRSGIASPLLQSFIIGLTAGILILITLDSSTLVAISCLLGSLFGGLLAKRRITRVICFNLSQKS